MNTARPTTSIIICVYTLERWADICEAVESARLQEPAPTEIILVCDHNPQLKAMCEAEFPDAVVVENRETAGLSGARNSGIAAARGSIVTFLDDDAVADKHFLAHLVAHLQQPAVIAASARFEPMWLGTRPSWFPDEFLWVVGCSYRGMPDVAMPVRNTYGGGMCARRELFHKVGGFNHRLGRSRSKLPLGCEETELCIRAQRAMPDGRIIYEPAAFAYHKVTAKRLTLGYFVLRCYAEGVSKAYLTTRVRTKGALALEARYVLRTLAPAFGRGFTELALRADVNALKRSFAIALGLASTCAGYLTGKFRIERTMSPRPQTRAADAVARQ